MSVDGQSDCSVPGRLHRRLSFSSSREAPNAQRQFHLVFSDEIAQESRTVTLDLAEATHLSEVLAAAIRRP